MSKESLLKKLIDSWVDYPEGQRPTDLASFADWLSERASDSPAHTKAAEEGELKMRFGYLLGRIINFTDLWGKLGFRALPIRQFEDLALLRKIREDHNPSKNELTHILVNEKSTVFEILKRLKRDRMIVDSIDEHDKRIRRVSLTPYGLQVLKESEKQARKIAEALVGNLSTDEISTLVHLFHKLDLHHSLVYETKSYQNIDDLLTFTKTL
jgi:DNA-binding MarR family transcriptional regulator